MAQATDRDTSAEQAEAFDAAITGAWQHGYEQGRLDALREAAGYAFTDAEDADLGAALQDAGRLMDLRIVISAPPGRLDHVMVTAELWSLGAPHVRTTGLRSTSPAPSASELTAAVRHAVAMSRDRERS